MKKRKIYLYCNSNLDLLVQKANSMLEDFGNKNYEIFEVDVKVDKEAYGTSRKALHVLMIHYGMQKPEVTPRA